MLVVHESDVIQENIKQIDSCKEIYRELSEHIPLRLLPTLSGMVNEDLLKQTMVQQKPVG